MANHKSAMKRNRQSLLHRARNRSNKTRMKGVVKDVYTAIAENSPEKVVEALKIAIPIIDRTAVKGTIHKRNAARKVSRLTKTVNSFLATAQA